MLRLNRGRVIGLLLTSFIVYFLFLSSSNSSPSDFRKRTEEGLSRRHGILQGDISDESYRAQTNQRLNDILYNKKQAEPERKPLGKAPEPVAPKKKLSEDDEESSEEVEREGTSVAGRKTMPGNGGKQGVPQAKEAEKPRYPKQQALKQGEDEDEDTPATKKNKASSDPGKDVAREKLQEYLKKPSKCFYHSLPKLSPASRLGQREGFKRPDLIYHSNQTPANIRPSRTSRDLQQILLPTLQARQTTPPQHLQNHPDAAGGRARHPHRDRTPPTTPQEIRRRRRRRRERGTGRRRQAGADAGCQDPGDPVRDHGAQDGAEHYGRGHDVDWWQRSALGDARGGDTEGEDYGVGRQEGREYG